MLTFIPIKPSESENAAFAASADCQLPMTMMMDYYKIVGYRLPWIGYFVMQHDQPVGVAGFKGQPISNKVEIAYSTFPEFQHQGIGKEMCRELVRLAVEAQPEVIITARTLPEHNYSTKILQHNSFEWVGMVWDDDDGNVWEWVYRKSNR
jgi:RimJ/RimL family protein N-acetyltransferase